MQGPFRGHGGALARAFGGRVTLHPGTLQETTVQAIFRFDQRLISTPHDGDVQVRVPVLRGARDVLGGLDEGAIVDPKEPEGRLFKVVYPEESSNPARDALVTLQLEEIHG